MASFGGAAADGTSGLAVLTPLFSARLLIGLNGNED